MIDHKEMTQKDTCNEETIPLLPLKNVVILPKSIIPVIVGRPRSIQAVEHALKHDHTLFIATQKNSDTESPTSEDVYQIGTRSTILQVMRMPNGALKILTEGICRAQISQSHDQDKFAHVSYQDLSSTNLEQSVELEALSRQLQSLYKTYTQLDEKAPDDIGEFVKYQNNMDYISDTIAVNITSLTTDERQQILELTDLKERIYYLCTLLRREIDILQTEHRIRNQVQTQVDKSQREYYLTEQIKAIQKELGRDDQSSELETMQQSASQLKLSKEAQEKVEKEFRRLEQMPPMSAEAVVSKNYIDWVLSLPWGKTSTDRISISQAEKILNKNHAGLKRAKERIIEFLAAKKFSQDLTKSPIICLAGPPGVGKTSLARSIADSLGREFIRISLGGVRDEAEIRGHRRTYIGALPGKIIQGMKRANTVNPVILLDEIDKLSRDMHGDPASALLEVLDPEQNKNFVDHYLDMGYDLSQVMFIATANVLDYIPYPLYDRLEIINLSGYTVEDKMSIAQNFLTPRNLREYGLSKRQFKLSEDLMRFLIEYYTREAGVRQTDRIIAKLMRKTIQVLLQEKQKSLTITKELITEWLGNPPHKRTSVSDSQNQIGLTTGLAWTEVGGDVLEIEVTVLPGKGSVTLTGQLGEVMQESAQAAMSYLRSRAADLGIKGSFYSNKDIHIHIPEGATPKDGPSAGITICTALVSALTKKAIKPKLAMTGEITLQGRVLAIGGIKEKLIASQQYGISTVILPFENKDDVDEVAKEVDLSNLTLIYAKNMDDVLKNAFKKDIFKAKIMPLKKRIEKTPKQRQIQA